MPSDTTRATAATPTPIPTPTSLPVIPSEDDPLLTVEELAKLFRVNHKTVRNWLLAGAIRGIKLDGRYWRVQHSEMVRFANERYGA